MMIHTPARILCLCLICATFGCDKAPKGAEAPAEPTKAPATPAEPAKDAAPVADAPRPAPPFEVVSAKRSPEVLAKLAEAICPGKVIVGDGSVGAAPARCPVCPEGSEEMGEDGVAFHYALVGDLRGDGKKVALLDSAGCESMAAREGGSFVLEQDGEVWRKVAYNAVDRVEGCEPVMFRGAGMLLCEDGMMRQGYQLESWGLSQLVGNKLELLSGGVNAECNLGGCPRAREACWETASAKIADGDGDGQDDLVWTGKVTVSTLKGGISDTILEECPERDDVPYNVEVLEVAQVLIKQGDALVAAPAVSIKDAALRTRVEAFAKAPQVDP
jgi:hypothetical protein